MNRVGLALDIVGVILLFFFGLPQPSHEQGASLALEPGNPLKDGTTVSENDRRVARRRRSYRAMAYVALAFLLSGFICQLVATVQTAT